MKWSWNIGSFRGIAVNVHFTFLILLAVLLLAQIVIGHHLLAALQTVLLVLLVFGCVVLHEFGHALTAQHYGVRTRDITLYPLGGLARLERIPRDPHQELWIALAGPIVNVAIAAGLYLIFGLDAPNSATLSLLGGSLMDSLILTNAGLALFNLLPAFPMDGGRVLRAFLAERMEYSRATAIAARVGQGMAAIFALVGILQQHPMLVLVALFVFSGAAGEAATVHAECAFEGAPVRNAMVTEFLTLHPEDPLARAVEGLLTTAQHEFPVVQNDQMVGVLTRHALLESVATTGTAASVSTAMIAAPPPVTPADDLKTAFHRMDDEAIDTLPVVEDGRLVGLVTADNLTEFVLVRDAVRGR